MIQLFKRRKISMASLHITVRHMTLSHTIKYIILELFPIRKYCSIKNVWLDSRSFIPLLNLEHRTQNTYTPKIKVISTENFGKVSVIFASLFLFKSHTSLLNHTNRYKGYIGFKKGMTQILRLWKRWDLKKNRLG